MGKKVNMEEIISSSFGEASSEIRANFKKTVLIRQYETEVIELETTLKLDKDITGAERMLLSAMLQAQLEYDAYCQLYIKGMVTESEFSQRKSCLEQEINIIKAKGEEVLGKSLDNYFGIIPS